MASMTQSDSDLKPFSLLRRLSSLAHHTGEKYSTDTLICLESKGPDSGTPDFYAFSQLHDGSAQ